MTHPAQQVETGVTKREPAVLWSSIGGGVTALLALLTAFGLELTADQTAAILGVVGALAFIITGVAIRSSVVSQATHNAVVNEAIYTPPPGWLPPAPVQQAGYAAPQSTYVRTNSDEDEAQVQQVFENYGYDPGRHRANG